MSPPSAAAPAAPKTPSARAWRGGLCLGIAFAGAVQAAQPQPGPQASAASAPSQPASLPAPPAPASSQPSPAQPAQAAPAQAGPAQTGPAQAAAQTESQAAAQPDSGFDLRYLSGSARQADLSRFARAGEVAPGRYRLDVRVNGAFAVREEIEFRSAQPDAPAQPCLGGALLRRLGVDLPAAADEPECIDLAGRIPHAAVQVDFAELALDLSVPQAALRRSARGAVAPELWQSGENALVLGYSYSASRLRGDDGDYESNYLGVELGANLGRWQYHQRGSLSWADGESRRWDTQAAYVERALPAWSGRLQLGRATAGDPTLGVYGFRGARLVKDERMVPDSLRGYAPVVRGTAYSNAVVEIRQRGSLLYRANVAPGPFEIDDLYAASNGGDLEVAVIEADGRVAQFRVANASNPQLRRAGSLGYEFVLGQVDETALSERPGVAQASAQYGFSNVFTGYAGGLVSRGYRSAVLGAAWNTDWGAFSLDANPVRIDGLGSALRWRGGYNRRFDFGLVVAATASVYADGTHLDLYGALRRREQPGPGAAPRSLRDSGQLSLSWPLGARTSLYLSGSRLSYRDGASSGNYQAGVRGQWRNLGIVFTAARVDDAGGRRDDQYFLGLTLPLGRAATAAASLERSERGTDTRLGISGSLGQEDVFGYGVSVADGAGGDRTGAANALYRAPQATVNASYGWGRGYRQYGWGVDGVAVLHGDGLTLGPQYGETLALVEADGAQGARLLNQGGARVDRRGYALAPYLIPYARNTVEIDPLSARAQVEIAGTAQTVVPLAGAVVRVEYPTQSGRGAILSVRDETGAALPFAAEVLDESGRSVGAVAQASRIYATGLAERGRLYVRWGAQGGRRCAIDYVLPAPTRQSENAYALVEAVCHRDDAR
ncbi:fimbria/pilus outer membrane usher protein [Lysobacter enzymogenes]|uniref:fimbria/pilus outer membrane usher protein n=1 Tax=Lysobacter enzymogenes TaxID=69 RepID=UPI001AF131B6|nr:fimbria/pilus outer membrane usher protein [Lysobacter enzymogenes]QQQ01310.1 fimbrial biogenesis outer membrane usher protein [Lysobacter enzymogenes]